MSAAHKGWTTKRPASTDADGWDVNYDATGSVSAKPVYGADGNVIAWAVGRSPRIWSDPSTDHADLIAAAPDLLTEVEREYIELADVHNNWPGRDAAKGQMKLGRLRDLIAQATGRESRDVQDDYGTRAAIARSTP